MPAAERAAIFSAAVPLPPLMMAPAWRRRSSDERHAGLGDIRLDEVRCVFFRAPADLADHDDHLGLRIDLERRQAVDEVRARQRIAADAHGRRLADVTRLADCLV